MKCEDCKKNQSTVNFTQIISNKKTVLHLCKTCAEKRGFTEHVKAASHSFGVENLVSKIANEYEEESNGVTCSRCGLKYVDFKQSGRLGCGHCYTAFSDRLDDLLRKIHSSNYHIGKMPRNIEPAISQSRQIDTLRDEMKRAIKNEDFEKAAELRDKIKTMEEKNA